MSIDAFNNTDLNVDCDFDEVSSCFTGTSAIEELDALDDKELSPDERQTRDFRRYISSENKKRYYDMIKPYCKNINNFFVFDSKVYYIKDDSNISGKSFWQISREFWEWNIKWYRIWNYVATGSYELVNPQEIKDQIWHEMVENYIVEHKINPYCKDVTKIRVLKDIIYYIDQENDTENEIIWRIDWPYPTFFKDFKNIKSSGVKRSETWTTQCSKTVQTDANNIFWLKLPGWDARKAVEETPPDNERFVRTVKAEHGRMVDLSKYSENLCNFADLSVESDTPNWKDYWHRAIAFQENITWDWYILDPYYSWGKWTKPQLLSEYSMRDKIKQANFYTSERQASKENLA